ncbi:hypothetical protein OG884_10820 [Streptosporangium sp. NBC_01755]|uniref:hypothetical protein n=1 Tax=unclassified Streptosporangium TaxID=2632669 RepID=UPI002DD7AE8C|nr:MULTISPECIES: hypothetical protein [unclassified Streptosporangium]WSA26202.1 hypothetical protein OIE13_35865 [Streptosporangium sp. NBC_01810]WSD02370.1 hypothetical protein OG884_10820 [Streptosporangium sp. NBC_01755]
MRPLDEIDPSTWKALAHPARVRPLVSYGEPTRVEIDLRRQLLTAWKDAKPLFDMTPTGTPVYVRRSEPPNAAKRPEQDTDRPKALRG